MKSQHLRVRNRRTATRLVTAVLLFHSLALASGVWLLRQASGERAEHPRVTTLAAAGGRERVAETPGAPRDEVREERPSALPDWVLQSSRFDTPAPWRTDGSGHVVLLAR